MQKLCSSPIASHYKTLRKLLIAISVFGMALSAAMPVLAETRSCDWALYIGTNEKNLTATMRGKASGSAGTVFFARRDAREKVINCYKKALNSSSKAPVCQSVDGWNQSFAALLPPLSNRYLFVLKVNSQSGSGCDYYSSFYTWK